MPHPRLYVVLLLCISAVVTAPVLIWITGSLAFWLLPVALVAAVVAWRVGPALHHNHPRARARATAIFVGAIGTQLGVMWMLVAPFEQAIWMPPGCICGGNVFLPNHVRASLLLVASVAVVAGWVAHIRTRARWLPLLVSLVVAVATLYRTYDYIDEPCSVGMPYVDRNAWTEW